MKIILLLTSLLFVITSGLGQDSAAKKPLIISGYAEVYYQYDFNRPVDGNRPGFIYSHNRHNEFNLNLGFIKAAYATEKVRANLAIATGTYVNANYAAEPRVLQNMFEANVGIKLSKKKNFWLDAGILPSHIGFESAVSKDCWALTRSLLAENSPYYETGAKITYTTDNEKWIISALALNGWQRITRVSGNSLMSWGTQLQYKPSDKILLNYSNFIGTDKPDSARQRRIFHNFYGIISVSDKVGLTFGFDIGSEEKINSTGYNTWFAPIVILKYAINPQWNIAGRAEYYQDKNAAIIATGTTNGFQTTGYSLNIDYSPVKNLLIRLEGRTLDSKDKIFLKGNYLVSHNSFITSSMAIAF